MAATYIDDASTSTRKAEGPGSGKSGNPGRFADDAGSAAQVAGRYAGFSSPVESTEELSTRRRADFDRLAAEWHAATDGMSSSSQIISHPAYLQIIGRLGPLAVPLILHDLDQRGGQWYAALRAITGANPVPDELRGNVRAMKTAWLHWGRSRGYVS